MPLDPNFMLVDSTWCHISELSSITGIVSDIRSMSYNESIAHDDASHLPYQASLGQNIQKAEQKKTLIVFHVSFPNLKRSLKKSKNSFSNKMTQRYPYLDRTILGNSLFIGTTRIIWSMKNPFFVVYRVNAHPRWHHKGSAPRINNNFSDQTLGSLHINR